LSKLDDEGKIILEPKGVIEIRTQQLQNQSILEYLIKWKNLPTEDSILEGKNFIQKHSKLSSIEDNFLKERGMLVPFNTSVTPYYYFFLLKQVPNLLFH